MIDLGASLTIREVQSCARRLRARLAHLSGEQSPAVQIDASALEQIDTAGLQLLLSAARSVKACGADLRLLGVGRLVPAARALGLDSALGASLPEDRSPAETVR